MFTSPVVWLLVAKYNSLWCTSLNAYLVCANNLPPCQKMARSNPPIEIFQLMVQIFPLKKFWRLNFLTCVWASGVPKPEWYAFIHHCMQCSYKQTVEQNRCWCLGHIVLQCAKSEITVFIKIFLHSTRKFEGYCDKQNLCFAKLASEKLPNTFSTQIWQDLYQGKGGVNVRIYNICRCCNIISNPYIWWLHFCKWYLLCTP